MTKKAVIKDPIVSELESIRKKYGGVLKPADVVRFARNKSTALHSRFCWDDTEAAKRYRLWQARDIIASVTFIPSKGGNTRIRAYVSLRPDRGEDSYRAVVDVLSVDEQRSQMLHDALEDLKMLRRRYSVLTEIINLDIPIAALQKAMDETVSRCAA